MSESDRLSRCLRNLSDHCESLCAENKRLQSQNEILEKQASSWVAPGLVPASHPPPQKCAVRDKVHKVSWEIAVSEHDPPSKIGKEVTAIPNQKAPGRQEGTETTLSAQEEEPQVLRTMSTFTKQNDSDKKSAYGLQRSKNEVTETLAIMRLGGLRESIKIPDDSLVEQEREGTVSEVLQRFKSFGDHKAEGTFRPMNAIAAVTNSVSFRTICMVLIFANTIYLGISADFQVKNSFRRVVGLKKEPDWKVPDITFAAWFAIELILRISAGPRDFFTGNDLRWNLFDAILVFNTVLELLVPKLANLSFLRIFRVFRVVRFVRVVRHVQALQSLRTMVFALMNSFVCLMWAFVMIFIIMFVFSLMFGAAIASYFDQLDLDNQDNVEDAFKVHTSFGSLYETLVSLFSAITGGNDWMFYGELLREAGQGSQVYFLLFAFYIGFCMVGLLNVVTGIFVDSAVCTRTEDEVVQCWEEEQHRTSEKVKQIFTEADHDGSGTLTYDELVTKLDNPWVKAYFSGLDIDPSEAQIIFTLMDIDGSEEVSIDEFVNGTMKLKGQAKSIDVMALMFDQARFAHKFNKLCTFVEEQMASLHRHVDLKRDEDTVAQTSTFQSTVPSIVEAEETLAERKFHLPRADDPLQGHRDRPNNPTTTPITTSPAAEQPPLPGACVPPEAATTTSPAAEQPPPPSACVPPRTTITTSLKDGALDPVATNCWGPVKVKDTKGGSPAGARMPFAFWHDPFGSGNRPHASGLPGSSRPHSSGPDAAGGADTTAVGNGPHGGSTSVAATMAQPLSVLPASALRPEQALDDLYL